MISCRFSGKVKKKNHDPFTLLSLTFMFLFLVYSFFFLHAGATVRTKQDLSSGRIPHDPPNVVHIQYPVFFALHTSPHLALPKLALPRMKNSISQQLNNQWNISKNK